LALGDTGGWRAFNLIVTHLPGPGSKRRAIWTLKQLIPELTVVHSRPNILLCRVEDPIKAIEVLRSNLPPKTSILRVIPVLDVRSVRVRDVRASVEKLLLKAGEGSFAIRLDGHLEDDNGRLMSRRESIEVIASNIDRRVNLRNPDILVYVKAVKFGRRWVAAIYVGSPSNMLSTVKGLEGKAS